MFKNMSIRTKITLWFSLALTLVALITYIFLFQTSRRVLIKNIKDNLVQVVMHNMTGLEYVESESEKNKSSQYIPYSNGFLEIDEDFLNSVNGVHTSLYDINEFMLYGDNPIAKQSSVVDFTDEKVQQIKINGINHYIFDKDLSTEEFEGLWMRGIISENEGMKYVSDISNNALYLLPVLILLTIAGGYLIAKRSLRPIEHVTQAAKKIEQSSNLKLRVDEVEGKNEANDLAKTFNSMISRLDKSFEAQKQFISDASHELRTPTTVIMAQSEYYLEKERSANEYIKALSVIKRQSIKMSKLIDSMLNISRLETKSEIYKKEKLDLSELTENICKELELIKTNMITLSYDIEKGVMYFGNAELLSRMLINLINNAYRYGKENGNTLVTLKTNKKEITISIRDNGKGIKSEDLSKIFDRFYQSDNARSGEGSGLGLPMVKEIVDFHKGEINVKSIKDLGTEFIIKFIKN